MFIKLLDGFLIKTNGSNCLWLNDRPGKIKYVIANKILFWLFWLLVEVQKNALNTCEIDLKLIKRPARFCMSLVVLVDTSVKTSHIPAYLSVISETKVILRESIFILPCQRFVLSYITWNTLARYKIVGTRRNIFFLVHINAPYIRATIFSYCQARFLLAALFNKVK